MVGSNKFIRKNIYRWHRISGLIIALPIVMWTVSGFLHPVMNSFKPVVNHTSLRATSIDTSRIHTGLKDALLANHINQLHHFRIVEMNRAFYYQVAGMHEDTLTYLSCMDGKLLLKGDSIYSVYLAEKLLNDPPSKDENDMNHGAAAQIGSVLLSPGLNERKPEVKNVQLVTRFTDEYRPANVLLPVYRVSFARKDGIRLYVETSTGRLAAAVDNRKAWFTRFFSMAHNWSFLDGLGNTKNLLLGIFAALCFCSTLCGFYIYNFSKNKKTIKGTAAVQRRQHRRLGNFFVLTTLLFACSGAWHSFHKLGQNDGGLRMNDPSAYKADKLDLPLARIVQQLPELTKLTNVSVVTMNGKTYWQLFVKRGKNNWILYRDQETFSWLEDGDIKYGCSLACQFAGTGPHNIAHSQCLKRFNNRYSMMNKRLPVVEVSFSNDKNYYVETSTGYLSAVTSKMDQAERFSFSNLHMQHFWEDWLGSKAGKPIRNMVLTAGTLGLLLMAATGTAIYVARRRKKTAGTANA